MHTLFRNLVSVLQNELELHTRLMELLGEEKRSLEELNASDILKAAKEKDTLALRLKALEESRRLSVESISSQYGLGDPDDIVLSKLADAAPEPERAELRRLNIELRATVESGQSQNEQNRYLASGSLRIVREAMKALAQPEETQKTYRHQGGLKAYRSGPQVMAQQA